MDHRRCVSHSLTIDDDAIRAAQRLLWDRLRLVVEPGATALAALHSGAYVPEPGERWLSWCAALTATRPLSPGIGSQFRFGENFFVNGTMSAGGRARKACAFWRTRAESLGTRLNREASKQCGSA